MIKAIIFDFDGVLVNSNQLKQDAWYVIFDEASGISREVITDVRRRIPETRFDILREIFTVARISADEIEKRVAEYAEKYDRVVQQGIVAGGVSPELEKLLPELAQTYRLYINSATPEEALERTVERIGFKQFFSGIFGRPSSKEENMARIFQKERIAGQEAIFIGDADSDYKTAVVTKCHFIGVQNTFNGWTPNALFPVIDSMSDLKKVIANIT